MADYLVLFEGGHTVLKLKDLEELWPHLLFEDCCQCVILYFLHNDVLGSVANGVA